MAAKLACMDIQPGGSSHQGSAQLENLCFVNTGATPPDPWVELFALFQKGLDRIQSVYGDGAPPSANHDLQWFCWVMARIHINAFRVDTIQVLDSMVATDGLGHDDATLEPRKTLLLKAAAGVIGGQDCAAPALGSAVYSLGSMFNHSCEPNVEVVFPNNNHQVRFVAACDSAPGTELTISYIDADTNTAARRKQLEFAYGFSCQCPRCKEED